METKNLIEKIQSMTAEEFEEFLRLATAEDLL